MILKAIYKLLFACHHRITTGNRDGSATCTKCFALLPDCFDDVNDYWYDAAKKRGTTDPMLHADPGSHADNDFGLTAEQRLARMRYDLTRKYGAPFYGNLVHRRDGDK